MIDSPWTRVRNPAPIPAAVTATQLRELGDRDFAELIRAHLMPREQDPPGRRVWEVFWRTLREDDVLADRAYSVLERFLDDTETALDSGSLDEAAGTRAKKFVLQCEMSWKRIDRGRDREGPLGWAGDRALPHPRHSRKVIATLIGAIARHRSRVLHEVGKPRGADADLWDTMRYVGFDPRDFNDTEDLPAQDR